MKIGTLVHMLFLLYGDTEEVGGFNTSMPNGQKREGVAEAIDKLLQDAVLSSSNSATK